MRLMFVVVVLAGCGSSAEDTCPTDLTGGAPCGFSGRCFSTNTFSSCESAWCTCEGGHAACTPLAPAEGAPCGDAPITQCAFEGNPSCTTAPTSQACSCDATGTWRCQCACYGGQTSCPIDPCSLPSQRLEGAACADEGSTCTYPDATCTCEAQPSGTAVYRCN